MAKSIVGYKIGLNILNVDHDGDYDIGTMIDYMEIARADEAEEAWELVKNIDGNRLSVHCKRLLDGNSDRYRYNDS